MTAPNTVTNPTNVELEFIRTYSAIDKKTSEFKTKLGAMQYMHKSCKLGVSESDRVLYIDKPSIFQGVSRWFYGQNRNVITRYLYDELMGPDGLVSLVTNLRDKCSELFMYCPLSKASGSGGSSAATATATTTTTTTTSSVKGVTWMVTLTPSTSSASASRTCLISDNTYNVFKKLCTQNIELLNIVAHGLGKLCYIYESEDNGDTSSDHDRSLNSTTLSSSPPLNLAAFHTLCKTTVSYFHEPPDPSITDRVIKYIQEMQKRIKFERVMLETILDKFNNMV